MAMCREKRMVLQENFTYFLDNIHDISTVVSHLFSANVITSNMEEDIMSKDTRRNKINELLKTLPKRGEAAFDKFYKALIDSEEHIAAVILEPHVLDRSLIVTKQEDNPVQVAHSTVNRDELPAEFPPDHDEDITVIPCPNSDDVMHNNYQKSLDPNNTEFYKNTKGLCLLIYNEFFDENTSLSELDWEKDVQDLTELFEKLGFTVKLLPNMSIEVLKKKLEAFAKKDMVDIDCLVVFVLTHGENGKIYGTDGETLVIQCVIDYFKPAYCPGLSSKPKLFFIQAASTVRMDATNGGPDTEEISIQKAVHDLKIGESNTCKPDAVKEANNPSPGDIYVCYSGTSDKVKPNESNSGSLFIQALIYAYKNYSYSQPLNKLSLKINALIKKGEIKNGSPATIGHYSRSTLNKSLYFFPGKFQCIEGDIN